MTDASSGQPNTPEQQPVEANPDKPTTPEQGQTDFSHSGPTSAAGGQAKSGQRRSNEFWLALAGMLATVIVGITGSWLAFSASNNQIKAESDRAALSFSREQKENAYANYLDALAALENEEYKLWDLFKRPPFDMKQAEDQLVLQNEAFDKLQRASSTVRLVASSDVETARKNIRDRHNAIQNSIFKLMTAARTGPPEKVTGPAADLHKNLDLAPSPLVPIFIDAAKKDLGLSGD
jgi:hypothetical protein